MSPLGILLAYFAVGVFFSGAFNAAAETLGDAFSVVITALFWPIVVLLLIGAIVGKVVKP